MILIDVEGYELNVLKGMTNTLKELVDCDIIIEVLEIHLLDEVSFLLAKHGFKQSRIDSTNYLFSKRSLENIGNSKDL